jgi:hypothetical protein
MKGSHIVPGMLVVGINLNVIYDDIPHKANASVIAKDPVLVVATQMIREDCLLVLLSSSGIGFGWECNWKAFEV